MSEKFVFYPKTAKFGRASWFKMLLGRIFGKKLDYGTDEFTVYKWKSTLYFFEKEEDKI